MTNSPIKLTPLELQSSTWLKLSAHMEQRLQGLREGNDGDHDEKQTAKMRGRIAQLKELLTLGTPESNEAGIDG